MENLRPVQIAGGGLAGLALGIALRRKEVPVRLQEAGSYPRHRVCGEFISGIQDDELERLGIDDLMADAARHQDTVWCDSEGTLLRASLPTPARGISRHRLDQRMADRFRQIGGRLETGTRRPETDNSEGQVMAVGRPRRRSNWIGAKAHYENLDLRAGLEIHLCDGGYLGLTQVEDGRVNACGLFQGGASTGRTPREKLIPNLLRQSGLPELADRLSAATVDPDSIKGVNQFHLGWQLRRQTGLRIGDQAAIIPPFTGNGMTMALQSALDAVEPLTRWSQGRQGWSTTENEIRRAQRKRFGRRLRWSWLLQGALLRPSLRTISLGLVQRGYVPFETLYRRVR